MAGQGCNLGSGCLGGFKSLMVLVKDNCSDELGRVCLGLLRLR